jgi:hypothetical protein
VIKVDLNSEDPKLVVEASVIADSSTHSVKLTQSINFDQDVTPPVVSDAQITISDVTDATSAKYTFDVTSQTYKVTNFLAKEGHTYKLTILVGGKTYISTNTIPKRVTLDSLKVAEYPFGPQTIYSIVPLRNDPAGITNYYLFRLKKNGKSINGIYTEDDQGLDGQLTLKPIFTPNNDYTPDTTINNVRKFKWKENGLVSVLDSIEAEIQMSCISEKTYRFFYSLSLNGGGQQSATPSNPDSMFEGGALGYFSAETRQIKKLTIKGK